MVKSYDFNHYLTNSNLYDFNINIYLPIMTLFNHNRHNIWKIKKITLSLHQ